MLGFLPPPLLGVLTVLLSAANTLFFATPLLAVAVVKLATPGARPRARLARLITRFAEGWVRGNRLTLTLLHRTQIEVRGPVERLSPARSYLMLANHRSWSDIIVLQHAFSGRAPFLKFFLKEQLRWVPVLGLAWWALDFPFMRRYSSELLKRRPELRGKDLETTRRACEKFRWSPVTVINFPEGTRFTEAKRAAQGAPYRHLLLPRAGGGAFVLSAMGDLLTEVLDVTIAYPEGRGTPTFWHLLSGQIPRAVVEVTPRPVPEGVVGRNYLEDEAYRQRAQTWLNDLWAAKDARLAELLAPVDNRRSPPHGGGREKP